MASFLYEYWLSKLVFYWNCIGISVLAESIVLYWSKNASIVQLCDPTVKIHMILDAEAKNYQGTLGDQIKYDAFDILSYPQVLETLSLTLLVMG